MTVELYYTIFIALVGVYAASCYVAYGRMKRFLKEHDELSSEKDISHMVSMARFQRNLVVVTIPFGGSAVLLYFVYGFTDLLDFDDTLVFMSFMLTNLYFTDKVKKIEKKIVFMPASSSEYQERRDHIVYVWHKTLFGKFE